MTDAQAIFQIVETITREIALFAAFGLLVGGINDLTLDVIWIVRTLKNFSVGRSETTQTIAKISPPVQHGKMAIFVPAWDEAAVIGQMLDHTVRKFAGENFRIFAGCYPNDPATIAEISRVAESVDNVKLVICTRAGPTTKADCLNQLWEAMLEEERKNGELFKAVILHDAEDKVHGDELKLFDRLSGEYALVQIPVVPLVDAKSHWVSGHYCDEFAEAHGKTLVVRQALGAGIPSAGVGCAINREAIGDIAASRGGLPFAANSLTEDYELGLRLKERGGRGFFARAYDDEGRLIAVEAHFPTKLDDAVRQKTRWITGIALDGWDRLGWTGGLSETWMRLQDRVAILSALVIFAAYISALASAMLLIAQQLTAYQIAPMSPSLILLLQINLGLVLWRIAMRSFFSFRSYGLREGLRSIPRSIVSNIIAMASARRALARYLGSEKGAAREWDKTDHVFPESAQA